MAAHTAALLRFEIAGDGKVNVAYAIDGQEAGRQYASVEHFKTVCDTTLTWPDWPGAEEPIQLTIVDFMAVMICAWWHARDADLSNLNLVLGKVLTFDLSAAQPIRVQ